MTNKTAAHVIADTLVDAGVKKLFTLSGNQIMPIYDALFDTDIELIHVRHEAAAVFMAEAWAQLSGELGVAMVTAAPGFINALSPLYSARCSETPVLLISGDAPQSLDGNGAFQELDQIAMSAPLTKRSVRAVSAKTMRTALRQVINDALSGRPGPTHLAVPFDVVNETLTEVEQTSFSPPRIQELSESEASQIRDAIANASRPLVIVGPSLSSARGADAREQLANTLRAPVVPMESPRGLKDPALGNLSAVLGEADLIVSLGKQLDFTTNFARTPPFDSGCQFIVVDPEQQALAQAQQILGERARLVTLADAQPAANKLGESASSTQHDEWCERVDEAIAARAPPKPTDGETRIHPAIVCESVQRALDAAAHPLFISDGGEFGQWAQAGVSASTRLINGTSGAIGGGLCQAVASSLHYPEATVIALMGDGTVGFHFSEFETALRSGAKFVAVIGHDAQWNAEVQIQRRDYGDDRVFATELLDARYDRAVEALGGYGAYVDKAEQLDAVLQSAIASGLPACVVVSIEGLPAPAGGH